MKRIFAIAFFCFVSIIDIVAQCPMCKATAESSLEAGGNAALGLNTGILYLFFTPYIIVAVLGGLWWYNRKKSKADLAK